MGVIPVVEACVEPRWFYEVSELKIPGVEGLWIFSIETGL